MPSGGKRAGAGRKKGYKSIVAERYNTALAKEVEKHAPALILALLSKAKTGDVPAIKEIHDRLMGRPLNVFEPDDDGNLTLPFQLVIKRKDETTGD